MLIPQASSTALNHYEGLVFVPKILEDASCFSFSCKLSADLAINTYLSAKLAVNIGIAANINLNVCSSLKADIDLYTGISVPIAVKVQVVPIGLDLKIGTSFGFELDTRAGGKFVLDADGKLDFKTIGFCATVEAAAKAKDSKAEMNLIKTQLYSNSIAIKNIQATEIKT